MSDLVVRYYEGNVYNAVTGKPEPHKFKITVNVDELAKRLAHGVVNNKTHRATALAGAVVAVPAVAS